MKKCKNCKYYTGITCHGHGDFWGECKKNKNTLFCYDETPCLQDVKTLRKLYYEQNQKITELQCKALINESYKTKYEIQKRITAKANKFQAIAEKYIPKEKTKEYRQELLNNL